MTNKEAIANLNHIYGIVSPDIQRSLDLAIKALETLDDVKRTGYRNEYCDRAGKCIDYISFHCAGCNGAKEVENDK